MGQKVIKGAGLRPNAGIKAWYIKELTKLAKRMAEQSAARIIKLIKAERGAAMDAGGAI